MPPRSLQNQGLVSEGTYQMAEDQARSWIVGGRSVGRGKPNSKAMNVDQRGVGISMTRT